MVGIIHRAAAAAGPRRSSSCSSRIRAMRGATGAVQHDAEDPVRPSASIARCTRSYGVDPALTTSTAPSTIDAEQVRVGQQPDRRRVDDHPVERLARFVDQPAHPIRREAGHRIGGRPAGGQHRQPLRDLVQRAAAARRRDDSPSVRPERVVDVEHRVERRPPQVGVDEQHGAVVRLAERQREVRGRERLALASDGARDHHDLDAGRRLC